MINIYEQNTKKLCIETGMILDTRYIIEKDGLFCGWFANFEIARKRAEQIMNSLEYKKTNHRPKGLELVYVIK